MAAEFEIYTGTAGKFRWRLKADNGEIVATGEEAYEARAGALDAIDAVKQAAAAASINDTTGDSTGDTTDD